MSATNDRFAGRLDRSSKLDARPILDPLAEVLRAVRLTGGVFLDVRLTAPWCLSSAMTAEDCQPILAAPAQLISFHVVLAGAFLLWCDDEEPVTVRAGEIVILPRNDRHKLASSAGLLPVRAGSLIEPASDGGLARIVYGGSGPLTHVICGFLGSDDATNPLIGTLPRVLTVDIREAASRDWIEASVRYAADELAAGRLASSDVLSRLSEVLFVEAVRRYTAGLGDSVQGWLRGLNDPPIGRALALIHGDIAANWSTESLARAVAMSRSSFVERFGAAVGLPPMRYLAHWRMQAARQMLEETRKPIAQIAPQVGYGSEEAFSRAYKRAFGLPPRASREPTRTTTPQAANSR